MIFSFASVIVLYSQYNIVIANPMIGANVRFAFQIEFPSVVSIKRINQSNPEPETDHMCTGTLISKKDVITAAHCEQCFEGISAEVIVGSSDIRSGTAIYVVWWMSFSSWASIRQKTVQYQGNDIAILRLGQDVPNSVRIAELANVPNKNMHQKVVSAAAFGSNAIQDHSRYKQTVDLNIVPNKECSRRVEAIRNINYAIMDLYLCAIAEPYALMTHGNSGCPIFYRGRLVGTHKGTCPNVPNVNDPRRINLFMSIFFYREFIDDVLNNF